MAQEIANLTYDGAKELLEGVIGSNKPFSMTAYSGGSRGHKTVKAATAKLYLHLQANSMFSRFANTQTIGDGSAKNPYKQRGGTLPPGHYSCIYMKDHPVFHECIRLRRDADTHMHYATATNVSLDTRTDDFYIHGRGPKGSDGCIVPANDGERLRLNQAVAGFKGKVILLVVNVAYLLPAERDDIRFA